MSIIDIIYSKQDLTKTFNNKIGYKLDDNEEFGIVRDTLVKYGMPIMNFNNNLSSLSINAKYNENRIYGKNAYTAGSYYANTNTLNLPNNKDDYVHELFHMASNNFSDRNSLMGCKIRYGDTLFGEGLNEGITDYFTSLAIKDYEPRHPVELLIVSYLSKIYGIDIFIEHFKGNANKFYSSFGDDEESINEITEYLDDYHENLQSFYDKVSNNEDMTNTLKIIKENANSVVNNFIDLIDEFIEFMQDKNVNIKEFISDLYKIISNDDNKYIGMINTLFDFSVYRGKNNVIKEITEKIDGNGFKL